MSIDWQAIVRQIGRSRIDFTISEWDDQMTATKIIRLTCNCCGHWAQQSVDYEFLMFVHQTEPALVDVIERLTLFMLSVNTNQVEARASIVHST